MVKQFYTPEDKRLPAELMKINASLSDIQRPTGTEKNRSTMKLEEAVGNLQAVVNEQLAQSAHTATSPNLRLEAGTPGVFPTFDAPFDFPGPTGGGRVATLLLSGSFVRESSSGNMTVWMELLQNGSSTWKRTSAFVIGDTLSAPPAWGNPSINDFIQINVPNTASAKMALRFYTHTFVSGLVVARAENLKATLTYGARL